MISSMRSDVMVSEQRQLSRLSDEKSVLLGAAAGLLFGALTWGYVKESANLLNRGIPIYLAATTAIGMGLTAGTLREPYRRNE